MKQLANDLDGLKEVMQDANQLVVMQGEPITGVQTKVETSKIDVEQGNADLAVVFSFFQICLLTYSRQKGTLCLSA